MKTKLIILFIGLMPIMGCTNFSKVPANDNYTINGTLRNIPDKTKIILEVEGMADTATIAGQHFMFSGKLANRASKALLRTENSRFYTFFWLENKPIVFIADSKANRQASIRGSFTQAEEERLDGQTRSLEGRIDSLSNAPDSLTAAAKQDKASAITRLQKELDQIETRYIFNHPASFISLDLLQTYYASWGRNKTKELYDHLDTILKHSPQAKDILRYLQINKDIVVGKPFVNFIQYTPEQKPVELTNFVGKGPLLIDFWASWCVPCRRNNRELCSVYHSFHSKGFEIVSISIDEDRANWLYAIKKDKLDWPQVSEKDGDSNRAAKIYGVSFIPHNVLIDKNGMVRAIDITMTELRKTLLTL